MVPARLLLEVYLDRVRDFLSPKTPNPQLKDGFAAEPVSPRHWA